MIRTTRLRAVGLVSVTLLALAACSGGQSAPEPAATTQEQTSSEAPSVEPAHQVGEAVDASELAEQISAAVAAAGAVPFAMVIGGDAQSFNGVLDATGEADAIRVDLGEDRELLMIGDEAYLTGLDGSTSWTRIDVTEDGTPPADDEVAALMTAVGQMARMAATSFRLLDEPEVSEATVTEASDVGVTFTAEHSDTDGDVELLVMLDPAGLPLGSRVRMIDPETDEENELIVSYGQWGSADPLAAPEPAEVEERATP